MGVVPIWDPTGSLLLLQAALEAASPRRIVSILRVIDKTSSLFVRCRSLVAPDLQAAYRRLGETVSRAHH
jgi:hypothetical protein